MRLLLLVGLLLWPLAPAATEQGGVRLSDSRITESSGLVDTGSRLFTVNDSGNEPLLFELDSRGHTVSAIRFADRAVDVEALAPGARTGVVWVGDIGDNRRSRDHIDVYRVGRGPVQHRTLRYPDGSHDAESMVVDRRGRIYVITKGFSGRVYLAKPGETVMRPIARVGVLLTDAALMPGQRHVLLRDYGTLHLYTFPGFEHLASMRLPRQPQGEGLAVSPSGRIRISSEGVDQPVLDVRLSPSMREALRPAPSPAPAPGVQASRPVEPDRGPTWSSPFVSPWTAIALVSLGLVGLIGLVGSSRRRRGSRL